MRQWPYFYANCLYIRKNLKNLNLQGILGKSEVILRCFNKTFCQKEAKFDQRTPGDVQNAQEYKR